MKQMRILCAILVFSLASTSCESYFDVKLDDQPNIEDIFNTTNGTKKYLAHIYSYIPMEEEIVGSEGWVVPRSDEAQYSFFQWVNYLQIKTGSYSSGTVNGTGGDLVTADAAYYNFWRKNYVAINQCSTFLKYVDLNKGESPDKIKAMKAEARFLRAFYYFCLFRQFGPVYIWGDQMPDETIMGSTIDRMTVDQNIDFIVGELDAIKNDLPLRMSDIGEPEASFVGRVTRGAALALKARVLLFAASPLYNGCDLYVGKMKNMRGEFLFPQTKDDTKWEAAAQAAWDVIDLGMYSLCEDNTQTDPFKKGVASYQKVMFDNWNSETIWGWWFRTTKGYEYFGPTGGQIGPAMPPNALETLGVRGGYGGIAPSLKLIDTYPMWETGRYPVTGYQGQNDLSKPIVDPQSGYQATGFTENYKQPADADWAPAFKAHNSCVGRDPRFYACLVPNGFYWPNKTFPNRFTCYDNAECTSRYSATSDANRLGYTWRRLLKPDYSLNDEYDMYKAIKYVYPAFRLAEVYLNYAEACNEKPQRDETAALLYLNKVRNRVGLKDIEEAYPEIKGNKELLRWCIQKERMVEFGLEAKRHYDACRWMIAKDEYPGTPWTLHLTATNYEDSYQRVNNELRISTYVFQDKDYLYPIGAAQLAEMTNMTQNYGF